MKMDHSNLKNFPAGFVLELWWMAMVNKTLLIFKITHIHKDIYHQNFEYFWTKLGIILLIASSFTADGSWTWWKSGQAGKTKTSFSMKRGQTLPNKSHLSHSKIFTKFQSQCFRYLEAHVISIVEEKIKSIGKKLRIKYIVSVSPLWKVSLTMCGTNA